MKKDSILKNEKLWDEAFEKYPDNVANRSFMYGIEKDMTKEEYINKYSNFSAYAVLMDGKWYEKGEMGWWAISTNENPDWQNEFNELIKSLPEDELLTIVDCHI